MLYIFETEESGAAIVRVSHLNPDTEPDYEKVLAESFTIDLDNAKKMPAPTKAGIVRNILSAGLPAGSTTLL